MGLRGSPNLIMTTRRVVEGPISTRPGPRGMDVAGRAHYVAPAMELLLILSAILSVVTGAFTGVRGPEARLPQAEAAVGAPMAVSAVEQQAPRPLPVRPAMAAQSREVLPLPGFGLAAAVPLYADRLIE